MTDLTTIVYTPSVITCLHCYRETAVHVRRVKTKGGWLNIYYCAACNATRYTPEE